jgi:hypothetical protein
MTVRRNGQTVIAAQRTFPPGNARTYRGGSIRRVPRWQLGRHAPQPSSIRPSSRRATLGSRGARCSWVLAFDVLCTVLGNLATKENMVMKHPDKTTAPTLTPLVMATEELTRCDGGHCRPLAIYVVQNPGCRPPPPPPVCK